MNKLANNKTTKGYLAFSVKVCLHGLTILGMSATVRLVKAWQSMFAFHLK